MKVSWTYQQSSWTPLTKYAVFEWDISDHSHGYDLWLKGVLADGGRRCRLLCEKENEPLIEGMLVGTKKDELNVEEGEAVRLRHELANGSTLGLN